MAGTAKALAGRPRGMSGRALSDPAPPTAALEKGRSPERPSGAAGSHSRGLDPSAQPRRSQTPAVTPHPPHPSQMPLAAKIRSMSDRGVACVACSLLSQPGSMGRRHSPRSSSMFGPWPRRALCDGEPVRVLRWGDVASRCTDPSRGAARQRPLSVGRRHAPPPAPAGPLTRPRRGSRPECERIDPGCGGLAPRGRCKSACGGAVLAREPLGARRHLQPL